LPGTIFDESAGERAPLYFNRNKKVNHIELLHQVSQDVMGSLVEHYIGLEWEQRYDALEAIREQERTVVANEPHRREIDEHGRAWDIWAGTRRTDEGQSAVGYYRNYPTIKDDGRREFKPDELRVEFRPLARGLSHQRAQEVALILGAVMGAWSDWSLEDLGMLTRHLGTISDREMEGLLYEEPNQREIDRPMTNEESDLDGDNRGHFPSRGYDLSIT
jgi:hypothetical protein